ncbi:inter-alpha-trypsin inhibitor [Rhipicephalus sanguineus]|uniref:inter-alpha-trypsin inhibitor n=1 Tax=Rhipicephalus sanguineus TaxID=34632 RepID=UPI0018930407|nr:inter-alpha-trypsin inhibitor [Rhipicephalus sanguineus]
MQAARDGTLIFVMAAIFALSGVGFTTARKGTDPCKQKIKETTGSCFGGGIIEQRWGYNYTSKKCVKYWYASCHSNGNNFRTVKQCLETCSGDSQCLKEPQSQWLPLFQTFYFNATEEKCLSRRTRRMKTSNKKNRFATQKECEDQCMPSTSVVVRSHSMA